MTGFELLFTVVSHQLRSANDLLVAVLHFDLIQKGFRCLGIGENFDPQLSESESELLPLRWNEDQETYVLRYFNKSIAQKLLVKCVKVSDIVIISMLLITGEDNGTTLSIKAEDYISNDFNDFNRAFTDGSVDRLLETLDREIVSKVCSTHSSHSSHSSHSTQSKTNKTNESQQQKERPVEGRADPLRVEDPRQPFYGYPNYYEEQGFRPFPPPIGGADLDPLGRGQGGMLFDPRNFPTPFGRPRNPNAGLPKGAVPPGARFDPFGPEGVGPNPNRNPRNRNPGPDADHFPPPGYDDMFM